MANRLLRPNDELKVGDRLLFRNRFNKNKYAICEVEEVQLLRGKPVYFYVICLESHNYYMRKGGSLGCDFRAHSKHGKTTELTYFMSTASILFRK